MNKFLLRIKLILKSLSFLFIICSNGYSQNIATYNFSALSGTFTPLTAGTVKALDGGSLDDGYYDTIPLGFVFNFGGTNYTRVSACTNGWISFISNMTQTSEINDLTAGLTTARPVIAPLWDDLYMSAGAFKYYSDTTSAGTDSVFTAEWLNVRWFYTVTTKVISFQAKLFKNSGRIQFIYRQDSTPVAGASASIGIMGTSPGSGNFISLGINSNPASPTESTTVEVTTNNVRPATGQIYQFDRPPVCSGIPVGGTASAFNPSVCKSSTTISLIGASGSGGIIYQWQDSTSGFPWASASGGSGANTANYTTPVLTAPRFYRCLITCSNGGQFTYSTTAMVNIGCLNHNVTRTTGITYNSILSTGTTFTWAILSGDDGSTDPVMLSPSQFNFTYAGQLLKGFRVCTNGWMTLDVLNTSKEYHNDFATLPYKLVFAPLWEDLVVTGNNQANLTNIRYQIIGSTPGSRILVVEWAGMEIYNNAGPDLNFQVRLYEGSNNIEYVYGKMQGFDGTNNYSYTYTAGLTSASVGTPIQSGQVFTQKISNTRSFDTLSNNANSVVAQCYSSLLFTPGTYTPYTPPSSTIPVNDSAGAPVILTVNPTPCTDLCGTYYSSAGATASSQIPTCTGVADDDVWFRFTAPAGGQVAITVKGAGGYDPVFQVMNSAYDTTGMGAARCVNASAAGFTETVNILNLIPSNNYFIRVYHSASGSGPDGNFSICVNQLSLPPVNDECSTATFVPLSTTTCTGTAQSSLNATSSSQTSCSGTVDDDVWFIMTATGTKARVLVQSGAGYNAQVEVYSGSCGALTSLKCINNTSTGGLETDSFTTIPSSFYYFRVYHVGVGAGSGNFTICAFNVNVPTVQSSVVFSSNTTANSTQVNWTNGNGSSRLVVALPTSAIVVQPSSFNSYSANSVFGLGSLLSVGSNNYVVYDGTGNNVTITGLTVATQYSFYVYEYNGTAAAKTYLTPGAYANATTLPVKLISFTGYSSGNDANLFWQTASETNNSGFAIERTLDGNNFKEITFIKGAVNTAGITKYSYSDKDIFVENKLAVYRLRQVDLDGKFAYSQILNVYSNNEDQPLSISPNPFKSVITINRNFEPNETIPVELLDVTGRKVMETLISSDNNNLNLTTETQSGIYFLKVGAKVFRILKE